MSTLNLLKTKLPSTITRNTVLDEVLGSISNSIDLLITTFESVRDAVTAEGAGTELNALATDLGLVRTPLEPDRALAIRIQNAIKTHQTRGSITGIEQEGSEFAGVTPYIQDMNFTIGVDPIGTGDALGAIGYAWIQFWVDVIHTEEVITQRLLDIVPINSKPGIDYIDVTGSPASYSSGSGIDFASGSFAGGELVGYVPGIHEPEGMMPNTDEFIFTSANIDLGATVANYSWMVDWIDYVRWDVEYTLAMEVRFSADGATLWSSWNTYSKNDFVAGSEIKRYAQFRFTLAMEEYDELSHYFFRKFILKGLTANQMRFGTTLKHHLIPNEIGN